MPNYATIADRAVQIIGSADSAQYQAAYDVMAAEVDDTPSYRELNGNSLRIWAAANPVDYAQLKAAAAADPVAGVPPEIAVMLVTTPDSALDLNMESIRALVDGLLGAGVLTPAGHVMLYGMAAEPDRPIWPGLEPGHVYNALTWRAAGEI